MLLRKGAQIERRERHHASLVLLGPAEEEFQLALLAASQTRQIRDEEDSARGSGEDLRGRLGKQLGPTQEWRSRRRQQAGKQLRPHATLASQQQGGPRLRELRQAFLHLGERGGAAKRREPELRGRRRLRIA